MNKNLLYTLRKLPHPAKLWQVVAVGLMLVIVASCEKHDFIDEISITGNIGPQAYWEVGSSTVSAGTEMPFELQYYTTTDEEPDRSEVWYNITEIQEKSVSCSWVTTFSYSVNSIISEQKRIEQKIQTYPHALAVWSDSLHAYTFRASFPVSGTLRPFAWVRPEQFDSVRMNTYFGTGFMQQFKDSLYGLMKFADFKNMMLGLSLVDNFKQYTDSTFDNNSNSFVYHFPKINGQTPVPAAITSLYNSIPFDRLIESAAGYNVEFKRTYFLEARMRVYDKREVYGMTVLKKIDIN
jgi:hypothetical protein